MVHPGVVLFLASLVFATEGSTDGGWSDWDDWRSCSATCGSASQRRFRKCDNPPPSGGGKQCVGVDRAKRKCTDLPECPVVRDGGWSEWSDWGSCSATCGVEASQTRFRICDSPLPSGGGKDCEGVKVQLRSCEDLEECPAVVNGGWSTWSVWSHCTATCGLASQHRFRLCNNPPPSPDGEYCDGDPRVKRRCDDLPDCPGNGDGGWSGWSDWDPCSATCGAGIQHRFRLCNDPPPSPDGKYCEGNPRESSVCDDLPPCKEPVDGDWSQWSEWSPCAVTRGGSRSQRRSRKCNNPPPSPDGKNCEGNDLQKRKCDPRGSGDGGWSDWGDWSICAATCGSASQTRSRQCNNPLPSPEGKSCEGKRHEKKRCDHLPECTVDGGWSEWTVWGVCTATCGVGKQERTRWCNNPSPSQGGKNCEGHHRDKRRCNDLRSCIVDGGWSSWSQWTDCSETCGNGRRTRERTCTEPEPENGGSECDGDTTEIEICRTGIPCPINGQWSIWSPWSPCSVTCGRGQHQRLRSCTNPPPSNGGDPCRGSNTEIERCADAEHCPIHGQWSDWTPWSPCLVTCGTAEIQRFRSCDEPQPKYGGDDCEGSSSQTKLCKKDIVCPVHGQWSEWSAWGPCLAASCYLKQYFQYRQRSCNNPVPAFKGRMCEGEFVDSGICPNPVNCPTDGQWGMWSAWSCAPNVAKRERKCDSPPPSGGGKPCPTIHKGNIDHYSRDEEEYREVCRKPPDDDGEIEPENGSGQDND